MSSLASTRLLAVAGSVTLAIVAGLAVFTAALGITGSPRPALLLAILSGVAACVAALRRAARDTPGESVPTAVGATFVVGSILLVVQLIPATAFIANPLSDRWESSPWRPMRSAHSCASAYWVASREVDRAPNIYDEALYSLQQADKRAPRRPRPLGPLLIDSYEYPPAFLVLPRGIGLTVDDFWGFRQVWFGLCLLAVTAGLVAAARRFDRATGSHSLWLTPFALCAPAMITTLVMGNVQLAIIAMSILGMVLVERRHYAAGGLLLAIGTVSKLYPGLLVFYLLLRRDWRAVAWTAAASFAIVAVTLVDFGVQPYRAFLAEMPGLLSGEAFAAFHNPAAVAVNESIPGLAFKLRLFGVPGMGFGAAKVLGWIYTVILVALTARFALRPVVAGREPMAWLAILILATLRSPFLPTYAPFPSLWLATLVAALAWRQGRSPAGAIACWLVLAFTFGTNGVPPQVNAVSTFTHTIVAFVLVGMTMRVIGRGAEAPPHVLSAVR